MKKILGLLVLVLLLGITPRLMATPGPFDKQVVTVHSGDTLWQIASRYCGDMYVLGYLDELKALPENKEVLSQKFIRPGDKVTVLVAQKKNR